jgi:hypothetical protein
VYARKTNQGQTTIFARAAALIALLAALPCAAQDIPDPGRRLSPEEQRADPEKRKAPAPVQPRQRSEAAVQACKNARINYQLSCGAPGSERSYSPSCAEAYVLYRQSCP